MKTQDIQKFKSLFSQYCREEINKGKCSDDYCMYCPIAKAYQEIFDSLENKYECKICGGIICGDDYDIEENLWAHIQMEHEDVFDEIQTWETPFMIEEYYEEV